MSPAYDYIKLNCSLDCLYFHWCQDHLGDHRHYHSQFHDLVLTDMSALEERLVFLLLLDQ